MEPSLFYIADLRRRQSILYLNADQHHSIDYTETKLRAHGVTEVMLLYIDTPALFSSVVGISSPLSQIIEMVTEKRRSLCTGMHKDSRLQQPRS